MSQSRLDMPFRRGNRRRRRSTSRRDRRGSIRSRYVLRRLAWLPTWHGAGLWHQSSMVGDPGAARTRTMSGGQCRDPVDLRRISAGRSTTLRRRYRRNRMMISSGRAWRTSLPRDPNVTNQGPTLGDSQQQAMSNNPATSPIIQQGDSPYLLGNVRRLRPLTRRRQCLGGVRPVFLSDPALTIPTHSRAAASRARTHAGALMAARGQLDQYRRAAQRDRRRHHRLDAAGRTTASAAGATCRSAACRAPSRASRHQTSRSRKALGRSGPGPGPGPGAWSRTRSSRHGARAHGPARLARSIHAVWGAGARADRHAGRREPTRLHATGSPGGMPGGENPPGATATGSPAGLPGTPEQYSQ